MLHIYSSDCGFVDQAELVAHRTALLQAVAPSQRALLQQGKAALLDWQHAMQVGLHIYCAVTVRMDCVSPVVEDGTLTAMLEAEFTP